MDDSPMLESISVWNATVRRNPFGRVHLNIIARQVDGVPEQQRYYSTAMRVISSGQPVNV